MTNEATTEEPEVHEPLVERIGAGLTRLSQGMRGMLWTVAKEEGLSPTQAQSLLALFAAAAPMTAGALAEQFGTSAPTISDVLNALERKSLIERRHSPEDRRQVRVHLTPAGRVLASRLVGWNGLLADALAGQPAEDLAVFFRTLLSLLTAMERSSLVQVHACPGCAYFTADAHPEQDRPHLCALSHLILGDADLRVDCPDYVQGPGPAGGSCPAHGISVADEVPGIYAGGSNGCEPVGRASRLNGKNGTGSHGKS